MTAAAIRAQAAAAERARIFATPVTQRFEVDNCILHCAGCGAELAANVMAHAAGCSEMRLTDLLSATAAGTQ